MRGEGIDLGTRSTDFSGPLRLAACWTVTIAFALHRLRRRVVDGGATDGGRFDIVTCLRSDYTLRTASPFRQNYIGKSPIRAMSLVMLHTGSLPGNRLTNSRTHCSASSTVAKRKTGRSGLKSKEAPTSIIASRHCSAVTGSEARESCRNLNRKKARFMGFRDGQANCQSDAVAEFVPLDFFVGLKYCRQPILVMERLPLVPDHCRTNYVCFRESLFANERLAKTPAMP
jgi:hypothetical protein